MTRKDPAMRKIGKVLEQKRLERRVTQADVAAFIGVSQETLSRIEAGTRQPGDTVLGKINEWLATSPRVSENPGGRGAYKKA